MVYFKTLNYLNSGYYLKRNVPVDSSFMYVVFLFNMNEGSFLDEFASPELAKLGVSDPTEAESGQESGHAQRDSVDVNTANVADSFAKGDIRTVVEVQSHQVNRHCYELL